MTTCCGSFLPEARETCVAAGIPMAIAETANRIMTGSRSATDREYARSDQSRTVAVDPHVPGPG
jgi:hypothetical protein